MSKTTEFCPITAASDLLGKKWTLLVLHYLHAAEPGRLRFCALQDQLGGLNPATLTQRLKELEAAGLVERVESAGRPLHVEYGLTRQGRELGPVVEHLNAWGRKWLTPERAPARRNAA
jgi:DNA-binding HxlR family transcriptional regulator